MRSYVFCSFSELLWNDILPFLLWSLHILRLKLVFLKQEPPQKKIRYLKKIVIFRLPTAYTAVHVFSSKHHKHTCHAVWYFTVKNTQVYREKKFISRISCNDLCNGRTYTCVLKIKIIISRISHLFRLIPGNPAPSDTGREINRWLTGQRGLAVHVDSMMARRCRG
jgi:hypothetical protein